MENEKDFLFRYMYLTLGFYATKHNYKQGRQSEDGSVSIGYFPDQGDKAREAIKRIIDAGLKPEDCGPKDMDEFFKDWSGNKTA